MERSRAYAGASYDRYLESAGHSTTHKLKNAYWTTKQVMMKKLGRKEDEHVVASDSELDAKLELFKSVQLTCLDLARVIERYQETICALSQAENEMGRYLKHQGDKDKTQAGRMMTAVGKSLGFSAQQRLSLRSPLARLHQEVTTFRNRAVSDTMLTVQRMEGSRTEYRAALMWMKNISEELNPDTYRQLERFRKVQSQVRHTKNRFDRVKLDSMQKIDLLATSRCNLFSNVLVHYQSSLLQFWQKTAKAMSVVAESFKGYQFYEFSMLNFLTDETKKLAGQTGDEYNDKCRDKNENNQSQEDIDKKLDDIFSSDYKSKDDDDDELDNDFERNYDKSQTDSTRKATLYKENEIDDLLGDLDNSNQEDQQFLEDLLSGVNNNEADYLPPSNSCLSDNLNSESYDAEEFGDNAWDAMFNQFCQISPAGSTTDNIGRQYTGQIFDFTDWSNRIAPSSTQSKQTSEQTILDVGSIPVSSEFSSTSNNNTPGLHQSIPGINDLLSLAPGQSTAADNSKDTSKNAEWLSLFADLDPLANPDKLSKKEGQISDA